MMEDRFRLNWEDMKTLPRKKRDTGATRDDLAERKFNMGKAKHKGRCHITNQKRRQTTKIKTEEAGVRNNAHLDKYRSVKAKIRAFWRGELDEHP